MDEQLRQSIERVVADGNLRTSVADSLLAEQPQGGDYTGTEKDCIYDLVDRLQSLFFGRYDSQEWENVALAIAGIVKAKQGRSDGDG